jgi:RND family efflux transporter MFP subunit
VVRAKASGTLLALNVNEGSRVAAGQTLGRIDLAEQTSRLAERSASVESARATLAQAERTHASNERLAAQQFISPIALENSRAAVDTARAACQRRAGRADTTRIGLRDSALVSPIAGIVAKRHVVPGEKLAMEQQVLTIVDLARLELAGAVGTHEVSRLTPGMPVQVQVEGVAQPVAGRIARIAPAAEPGTRSIGVTIELPNPKETAARRPVRGGPGGTGRRHAAADAAAGRGGQHRGAGPCLDDREAGSWRAGPSSWAGATSARAVSRWSTVCRRRPRCWPRASTTCVKVPRPAVVASKAARGGVGRGVDAGAVR